MRTCVLSREEAPRAGLIRLALAPDGSVHPDVRAKAPGRGGWIGVDRATLEAAIAKGRLRGGLARAFRTGEFTLPDDLPQRIEDQLRRAALDRLGLEAKAGHLLTGSDKIAEAARAGRLHLLLHAADAGDDGSRKLAQAWRVGSDREGSDLKGMTLPVQRTILSLALGRENVVHAGLIDARAAKRVSDALVRWLRFIGPDSAPMPCETGSQGASAFNDDARGPAGTNEGFEVTG
ncbi:DUF448 domain-containing protein [Sphingomonas baiyangensis]|uniref:DUF448 domain-containing protein n=1 Tax=Sphingomonas baiyangensis TaxID=2572576 RepID=UPI0020160D0A|nr:DUF448 domain-containing protein [Sphingomonas baiyangensis]